MDNIENYISLTSDMEKAFFFKSLSNTEKLNLYLNSQNNYKSEIISFCDTNDLVNIFKYYQKNNKDEMRYFLLNLKKYQLSNLYRSLDAESQKELSDIVNDFQLGFRETSEQLMGKDDELER